MRMCDILDKRLVLDELGIYVPMAEYLRKHENTPVRIFFIVRTSQTSYLTNSHLTKRFYNFLGRPEVL